MGAAGYAGRELLGLLRRHPGVEVVAALGSDSTPAQAMGASPDFAFLATPAEVSAVWAPALAAHARVIDLSGAYRLDDAAVYGWPERNRERIKNAALVANPGCYATAANLALGPLLAANAIAPDEIICDAKSGASGAGRALRADLHFVELAANCKAYNLYAHRHAPEIARHAGLDFASFAFTPHLLPTPRGLLATCYVRPRPGADLAAIYAAAYRDQPFVRLRGGAATDALPELNDVNHTNFCDLGWRMRADGHQAILVSALDNLLKGAAGQALQNFNLMAGWPETTALA